MCLCGEENPKSENPKFQIPITKKPVIWICILDSLYVFLCAYVVKKIPNLKIPNSSFQ
jgi:hypothetical protein